MTTTLSSSLASLQQVLSLAALPLSPSTSARTGATGSSEEPGQATRSLLGSVASHQLQQVTGSTPRDSPPPSSPSDDASASDHEEPVGQSPVAELRLPLSAVRSDTSWCSVSLPSLPPLSTGDPTSEEEEDDEPAADRARMTDGQEAELLRLPVTRSQSELRHWLRTTISQARGDGTSTVDSEDALSVVADMTIEGHLGLGANTDAPVRRRLASAFKSQTPSLGSASDSHDLLPTPSATYDLDELLASETMLFDSLEENAPVEVKEEETKPNVEAPTETKKEPTVNFVGGATLDSGRRWKAVSVFLASSLAAALLQPRYDTLRVFMSSQFDRFQPLQAAIPFTPVFVIENVTTVDSFSVGLGKPLAPVTRPVLLISAAVFVIALLLHSVFPRRAPGPSVRTRRATSPLLEMDPASILEAQELLSRGTRHYRLGRLQEALKDFDRAASLNCTHEDKAVATEWLGRTRYRLARLCNSPALMRAAADAFSKAVLLDHWKATPRASLGRALYALGDLDGAIKPLETALRRDNTVAFAHEYLGKTLVALGRWRDAERHLREATSLDEMAYTAHAFLGERLHIVGRMNDAKVELEKALQIRWDYPAAHARLAFIATEQLDSRLAVKHLRLAIQTRDTGVVDDNLPIASMAIQGPRPFLSLYFALPATDRKDRLSVLSQAIQQYPHEQLLVVLRAVNLRRSTVRAERHEGLTELRRLEEHLGKRTRRYPDEVDVKGLFVLVLFALGRGKMAERQSDSFWQVVSDNRSLRENPSIGMVVMALLELKRK